MKNNSTFNIHNSTFPMPDGTMKKLTDVSKLHTLGWRHSVELKSGIEKMYEWYLKANR